MKLRFVYAALGAFLGFVVAYTLTAFLTAALGALFWKLIYGDNPWPSWTGSLLITTGIVSFVGSLLLSVLFGYQYGKKMEQQSKVSMQQAGRHLFWGFAVLFIFTAYLFYKSRYGDISMPDHLKGGGLNSKVNLVLSTIENVQVNQMEDGLEVAVVVNGPTDDKYELSLNLIGRKFVQDNVFQEKEPVELRFAQQSFHFQIPFNELSKVYRKAVEGYALNFNQKFDVDEILEVNLQLNLLETSSMSAQEVAKLNLAPQTNSSLLRLHFNCYLDQCDVVQQKENPPQP